MGLLRRLSMMQLRQVLIYPAIERLKMTDKSWIAVAAFWLFILGAIIYGSIFY